MFTNARVVAIMAFLLIPVISVQAAAAELSAKIDREACQVPAYPAHWRVDDQQGAVILSVLVKADGSVADAKVLESSGYSQLDRASLRAGANCKFKPGTKDGQAVPSWVKVRYSWIIN